MAPQVVVTGMGVVCSTARSVGEFVTALRTGRCGARPITLFDTTGFAHAHGCEVRGFRPEVWVRRRPAAQLSRASQFAVAAARMAVADAGVTEEALRARRGLVAVGTTDGGGHELDQLVAAEIADGPERLDPALAGRVSTGRLATAVTAELGLSKVAPITLGTACASGNYAIGHGLDALRAGEVDFALCGGTDALCRRNFTGFYRLGLIAPDRCQPFDVARRGLITGEGAGMLFLEPAETAEARGARIYAEVRGFGLSCDAAHPIAPQQEGVERCIRLALRDADVVPSEVDVISAHGTGTRANDVTESRAIRAVFGPRLPRTVAVKSMLGHTMGAASALAGIACVLSITHGFVPPTINHGTTDPECDVDCVPNQAIYADVRVVLNNGLAFGGNNAVVVLGRFEPGKG